MAFSARSWRRPDTVSVFCAVQDDDVPELRALLAECEPQLRLDELATVHFLRLFIIDADRDLRGHPLRARLVVSAVFDDTAESFLTKWVEIAGEVLLVLFSHCVDGPTTSEDIVPFLIKGAVQPDTFHIGPPDSSVSQIRDEERLANRLRGFIDAQFSDPALVVSAEEVRRRALAYVKAHPDLPQQPRPDRSLRSRVLQGADLLGTGAVATSGLMVAGIGAGVVRYLELTEPDVVIRQDDAKVETLESVEDLTVQNQFTMVAAVRDSTARRLILQASLFLSDAYSKHLSNAGQLVGVETIHYARIHRIDGGRRFLFMSDFDGGWNRYLFDFLTTGAFAVVPNWTNLLGCPKTDFLLIPGSGFTQRFLPFTRARQIRTDVWYSAFPQLTVTDILKHAEIRRGLFSTDTAQAERWVRLL